MASQVDTAIPRYSGLRQEGWDPGVRDKVRGCASRVSHGYGCGLSVCYICVHRHVCVRILLCSTKSFALHAWSSSRMCACLYMCACMHARVIYVCSTLLRGAPARK